MKKNLGYIYVIYIYDIDIWYANNFQESKDATEKFEILFAQMNVH